MLLRKPYFVFFTLLILAVLLPGPLSAQTPDTARQAVDVDYSDLFELQRRGPNTIQKLVGEVSLHQDSIYMYCDSAIILNETQVTAYGEVTIQQGDSIHAFCDTLYYDGILKEAEMFGNVVLENGDQKLFTQQLFYDLNTKMATYLSGATLTSDSTQLTSQTGYYYADTKTAYFKDSVVVVDPRFSLRSDTLKFEAEPQVVYFLGPTLIRSDSSLIYCEDGFYDIANEFAEFRQRAQFERGDQRATADVITYNGAEGKYLLEGDARTVEGGRIATADFIEYDGRNDRTVLSGNAFVQDSTQTIRAERIDYDAKNEVYTTSGKSVVTDGPQILQADGIDYRKDLGLGIASGNVYWRDTSANLSIVADSAAYNQNTGFMKASGGQGGRPLLISIMEGDSLFMTADTLIAARADTVANDSSRLLRAYHDVRIYKSDLQALCDSLSYSTLDSTFRLFREPLIWADTSQFAADSIQMVLADEKIDKIYLRNRAFIINSPDEIFFNQIKGKFIEARFVEENLRQMDVEGNAESIYYALDDSSAYIGVNKVACSEMRIFFADNVVEKINFYTQPQGKLEPMGAVDHVEIRLDGFNWQREMRPKNRADLFGPPLRTLSAPRPAGPLDGKGKEARDIREPESEPSPPLPLNKAKEKEKGKQ